MCRSMLFVCCLTSQQHASVSWGQVCLTSQQHASVSRGQVCLTSQQHASVPRGQVCLTSQQHASVPRGQVCLTSQQHASVPRGQVCSDSCTFCHTEVEDADQTFYLIQPEYTDTRPTSPSADAITPGVWQARVATRVPIFKSLARLDPDKSPQRKRESKLSRWTPQPLDQRSSLLHALDRYICSLFCSTVSFMIFYARAQSCVFALDPV